MKDGVRLDAKNDENFYITHTGDLIINVLRIQDQGNYTCGAENIVKSIMSNAVASVRVKGKF